MHDIRRTDAELIEETFAPHILKLGLLIDRWLEEVELGKAPLDEVPTLGGIRNVNETLAQILKAKSKASPAQIEEFKRSSFKHGLEYYQGIGMLPGLRESTYNFGLLHTLIRRLTTEELESVMELYALPPRVNTNFQPVAKGELSVREVLLEQWINEDTENGRVAAGTARAVLPVSNKYLRAVRTIVQSKARTNFGNIPEDVQERFAQSFVLRELHRRAPKVYEVSTGLSKMLSATDCSRVPCRKLSNPHKLIYIVPPQGAITLAGSQIYGIYVWEHSYVFRPDEKYWAFTFLREVDRDQQAAEQSGVQTTLPITVTFNMHQDQKVATLLDLELQRVIADVPGNLPELRAAIHWVVNSILYLTLPSAQVIKEDANKERSALVARLQAAKGSKREHIKDQLRRLKPFYRILVGKNVVMQRRDATKPGRGAPSQGGALIPTKLLIPGHWRRIKGYAKWELEHPEAHSDDVPMIWIEPYIRGPEDGLLIEAKHRMILHRSRQSPEKGTTNGKIVDSRGPVSVGARAGEASAASASRVDDRLGDSFEAIFAGTAD